MNWLTERQVRAAAKRGRKAAIKCSQEHWRQLSAATEEEIRQADYLLFHLIRTEFCALCQRYYSDLGHGKCPLKQETYECCAAWQKANTAAASYVPGDKLSWCDWKRTARAMYRKVKRCK